MIYMVQHKCIESAYVICCDYVCIMIWPLQHQNHMRALSWSKLCVWTSSLGRFFASGSCHRIIADQHLLLLPGLFFCFACVLLLLFPFPDGASHQLLGFLEPAFRVWSASHIYYQLRPAALKQQEPWKYIQQASSIESSMMA